MNTTVQRLFSLLLPGAFLFGAACDGNNGTGGAGSGGSMGGSGGGGGTGGEVSPWPVGPGTPGDLKPLAKGMPFAQGLSKGVTPPGAFKLLDACSGGGAGGSAGAGGSGGAGGSPPVTDCPTSYVPQQPVIDFSQVTTTTDLQIVIAAQPVFQPVAAAGMCATDKEPISFGAMYMGDCTGMTIAYEIFTPADLGSFYGMKTVLQLNTEVMMNGGLVRLISGSSIRTAEIGDVVYLASNTSSTLITFDTSSLMRTDVNLGLTGIGGVSGLVAMNDGTLLFSTLRTFTAASWNTAMNDPANLVEDKPIYIKRFDPVSSMVTDFATISGGSRVTAQNGTPASVDGSGNPTSFFIAGSTNAFVRAQDGSVLFSDRLAGKIYKITADGATTTELLTVPSDVLVSGMTEAPNGVLYVVKSATADASCISPLTYPEIAYWDPVAMQLVDFKVLNTSAFDETLLAVCKTGVMERDIPNDIAFLGGGLFVDIIHDTLANLVITASVTGGTQVLSVLP